MTANGDRIVFEDVSKFYGETLGVNRVNLSIPPGITSLVGPNGAGKTTLMNLMTGLLRPTRGAVRVLGADPSDPEGFYPKIGYCTQYDSFPAGLTGLDFVRGFLRIHGHRAAEADSLARRAIERAGMADAAGRRIGAYSKGMRQRIKLAQAIAHEPRVLVLDEPLNGLDPMARAEAIDVFKKLAAEGLHLVLSSHILHEVDLLSDQVVVLHGGYVAAEGEIRAVRREMTGRPLQIAIRCDRPSHLAARAFDEDGVLDARLHADRRGLVVSTADPDGFYRLLNRVVLGDGLRIESVAPADDDVHAVYQYLVRNGEGDE